MTIPAGNSISRWTGNGTADTFDYEFKISAAEDLLVTVYDADNVATELTLEADYTVAGVGNDKGSITLTAGPLDSGKDIVLKDNVEASQLIPFGNQSRFAARTHESAFDKNVRLVKRVLTTQERTLKMPSNLTGFDMDFPSPVAGASVRFNAAASALETFNPTFSDVTGPTHSYFMEYTDGPSGSGISGSDLADVLGINLLAGDLIRTDHYGSSRVSGSGAVWEITGIVDENKAGQPPHEAGDGFGYDGAGNQFRIVTSPMLPEQFGALGDGSTDDEQALIAVTGALSYNKSVKCRAGATYFISRWNIEDVSDIDLQFSGAIFRIDSDAYVGSTAGVLIRDCENVTVDNIRAENEGGYEVGRSILVALIRVSGFRCGSITSVYDNQHLPADNNPSVDPWQLMDNNRSIYFQDSDDLDIGTLVTRKADVPIRFSECTNVVVNYVDVDTYMKGVNVDGGDNVTINSGWVRGKTPTFVNHLRQTYNDWRQDRPGNNGFAISNLSDFTVSNLRVEDSGEHTIRIAGSGLDRHRMNFSNITTKNSGAAGIKVLGSDTTYLRESTFSDLNIIDCKSEETQTLDASTGATEFVYDSSAGTITISGIEWPDYFGGDITSVTISGSASNNGTFTITSRDSDTVISVSESLTNETDSTPSSAFTWTENLKSSHGLMLYNVRDITVTGLQVTRDNLAHSCQDGISFHDAARVEMSSVSISVPRTFGIGIRPSNGGTFNNCGQIQIDGFRILSAETGLWLTYNDIQLDHIVLQNGHIESCTVGIDVTADGGTTGSIVDNCYIDALVEANGINYQSDDDSFLLTLKGANDATKDTNARNGSTWQVKGDTLHVLKAGTWTAL